MDAVLASTIDLLEDVVKLPDWQSELAFTEPRHAEPLKGIPSIDGAWRLKERIKTVSVALVLCLNVGVDPPDVVKLEPYAHLESWFDPLSEEPQKAIEYISLQLEKQYEQLHSRARYKKCLDPTVDEVKRLCTSLRRYSKEDRVLFHYNGHGVPRPTPNGEIWVFNEKYTQYIPLAIYDLQRWLGTPAIYVFDCSSAGSIVESYIESAKHHKRDYEMQLIKYTAQQQIVLNNSNEDGQQNHNQNQQPRPSNLLRQQQQNHKNQQQSSKRTSLTNEVSDVTRAKGNGLDECKETIQNNSTTAKDNDNTKNSIGNIKDQQQHNYKGPPIKPPDYESCFHLAACEANQMLPMQPDLPADLFTSCLTTPIKMALRWFIQKNNFRLMPGITLDLVDKIPGSIVDRKSMFGELNWIFTAVTDTIAWDVLPRNVFQRLYRQDLLVASLFRNFLLADRIMRTYDCTPVSHPKLPKTYHHPMWRAWDMVVDLCLTQLIDVVEERQPFKTSSFFAEQLTAFEVWLDLDHSSNQQTDHQLLPILLQVILSPVHRLRALDLLNRFLNLGPSAVHSALSVGIFPYVLKLLQSDAREVRPYLLSIWSKILAIDRQCQVDLVRDKCHRYFLNMLSDTSYDSHYRTKAAFVISCIVRDYPLGQEVAYQANLISHCLEQLDDNDPMLRKWLAICLGLFWDNYEDARWYGVRSCAHEKLYTLLDDPDPEVRAATVFALGTFVNCYSERTDHANTIDHSIGMKLVSTSLFDSSYLVRHELVVALQYLVLAFESQFQKLEQLAREEERKMNDELPLVTGTPPSLSSIRGNNSGFLSPTMQANRSASKNLRNYESNHQAGGVNLAPVNLIPRVNSLNAIPLVFGPGAKIVNNVYHIIWKAMYTLAADPHAQIASSAQIVIDEIRSRSFSGMSIESLKESKSISSISEGSSPNTGGTFSISESPPSTATTTTSRRSNIHIDPQNSTIHFTNTNQQQTISTNNNNQQPNEMQHNRSYSSYLNQQTNNNNNNGHHHNNHQNHQHHRNSPPLAPSISQYKRPTNISEDDSRSNFSSHKPLITTDFVDWCGRYFVDAESNYNNGLSAGASARTSGCGGTGGGATNGAISGGTSCNREDQQREWRMLRVMSYRNVCLRELQVLDPSRFNESVINYKISQQPQLMIAHPYDPILVFAGKHEFSIMHLEGTHANNYKNPEPTLNGGHHNDGGSGVGLNLSASSSAVGLLANVVAGATNITNHHNHYNTNNITNNGNHHHHHLLNGNSSSNHHHHLHNGGAGGSGDFHINDLIGTQTNCSNNSSSHITSLQLINPQYNTLICTGNSDGSVRIWRAYNGIDYSFNPQLISAYNLMPELLPNRQGLGMVLLWDQNQTKFYVTSDQNDVRIIKVWDAQSESKVQDIPTCAEFGVSCLSSDSEHCIAAGFLDGSIRIYDTRLKKTDCRVSTFRKHSEKILGLHMFKPGDKHINLISGDSGGEVRFWDKRAPTSVKRLDVGQKMNVMTVHRNADVFACGLRNGQGIKIYNLDGSSRAGCVIKCQEGGNFFTSRHNPSVSSLTFHPLKPSLIAGYSDAVISVYSSK